MIKVTTLVVCDGCGKAHTVGTAPAPLATARKSARAYGWRSRRRGRIHDYCPPCAHAEGLKDDPYTPSHAEILLALHA